MTGCRPTSSFASRAGASAWVRAEPGLAEAITALHAALAGEHAALAERAVVLAQPGPVNPWRFARHATAASVSRALRVATGLPAVVATRRPLTDPTGFLRDAAVEAFVDQLALGGAASAELARLINGGGALFPEALRRELDRRHIAAVDLPPATVQAVLDEVLAARAPAGGGPAGLPGVRLSEPRPVIGTPVAPLYAARAGGDGGDVLVRVQRPRIAGDLLHDVRLAAAAAAVATRLAPDAGGTGPIGFVRLVMRQHLEASDLRFEALGLVELGMALEELGHTGIVVAHPHASLMDERALVIEPIEGTPLRARPAGAPAARRPVVDPAAVLPALVGATVESAIAHGVFWADPAPEHLLVRPDGRLALVGVCTLGRFGAAQRLAGIRTLRALLTGDYTAMIEGLRLVGALGADVDTAALVGDLAARDQLRPVRLLTGGEGALLEGVRTLVGIMLAHRLEPPVEVALLLRTLFALGRLVAMLTAEGDPGLVGALAGLLPRLPALLAAAEEEASAEL